MSLDPPQFEISIFSYSKRTSSPDFWALHYSVTYGVIEMSSYLFSPEAGIPSDFYVDLEGSSSPLGISSLFQLLPFK